MEITTKTIIFTIIALFLVAAILGGVYYLFKNSKQLNLGSKENPLSKLPVIQTTLTSTPSAVNNQTKTYSSQGFILSYPANWGILTCDNSKNIELDPYHSNDLLNYPCEDAIKPITVLIRTQSVTCPGEIVKIGNNNVLRSKAQTANWLKNRWCLNKNGIYFDITNRIAPTELKGTGKDDFSSQIEQIIKSL